VLQEDLNLLLKENKNKSKMELNYSYIPTSEKIVKSSGKDLDVSFKDAVNVARAIKGRKLEDAMMYLNNVISFKDFIPYKKFYKGISHRSEVAGKSGPGRYPIKVCKYVLKLLKSAERNAEHQTIDTKNLIISHVYVLQGTKRKRLKPTGRRAIWGTRLTHIQIILKEMKKENNM